MKISVIGGGIGGLCAAIALQRSGHEVKVYEKSECFKPLGAGIALGANAIKALESIGLAQEIIREGKSVKYVSILDNKGRVILSRDTFSIKEKYGLDNFAIHRGVLHEILMRNLNPGTLCFGYKLKSVEEIGKKVKADFEDNSCEESDCLIGADGIHSQVRKMLLPNINPRYSGYTCWRAIIDKLPANFSENSFTETWGTEGRFGIVPLSDNKIYWYACINSPLDDVKKIKSMGVKELLKNFESYHNPIPEIISLTQDYQLIHNDIIDLVPLSRYAFGNILLIGDAAHATTPNMGQGACQAIEDAVVLSNCISKYKIPVTAFANFQKLRSKRTHTITKRSWFLGKIAQLESPVLCKIRNAALRLIPEKVNEKQLDFLFDVDFKQV